jgi:hypothetical protein
VVNCHEYLSNEFVYIDPCSCPHLLRAALMVMLDMKLGGGVMDAVNEGQKLVRRAFADADLHS